jgi:MraZ protein
MVELMGEYRHKLDSKGRLTLPSKLRADLSGTLVVMVNPKEECLYAFTAQQNFDEWMESVFEKDGGYNASNSKHVNVRRVLKARATSVDIDSQNRINLKDDQCKTVKIDKDVVLVGNTGYFEIWDAKRWDEFCAEVDIASYFD